MDSIIVIGTSAGGVHALKTVLSTLPPDFPAAVLIVMHVGTYRSILPGILDEICALPVRHAADGEPVQAAQVLVAPPDRHMTISTEDGQARVRLSHGPKENHSRPAIDPLFRSAAQAFGPRLTGVILTGYLNDGTSGLRAVKACGGHAIVQDPSEAHAPNMPGSALNKVAVDQCLALEAIGPALVRMVQAPARRETMPPCCAAY
ncbi:MAG: chemotaxis protein CheB [Pseudomonadota bacterium]